MHARTSPSVRRRGLAAAASVVATSVVVAAPAVAGAALIFGDRLRDYAPAAAGPFDGATARATLVHHAGSATVVLGVRGVDPAVAGHTFGAHLHVGPCVAGSGLAAGAHDNHSTSVPAVVDRTTEVWLDFTVTGGGTAESVAHVSWFPEAGQRSIVVHERATASDGTAGARLACLPVEW
jgi:hypothetical protein